MTMIVQIDNPRTRKQEVCPLCRGDKARGLVTCWPCYHRHGLKYGSQKAEASIAAFEASLVNPSAEYGA